MVKKLIRVREILTKQRDNKQLYECATNYRKVNLRKKLKSARDMDKNIKLKILFRMHQKITKQSIKSESPQWVQYYQNN